MSVKPEEAHPSLRLVKSLISAPTGPGAAGNYSNRDRGGPTGDPRRSELLAEDHRFKITVADNGLNLSELQQNGRVVEVAEHDCSRCQVLLRQLLHGRSAWGSAGRTGHGDDVIPAEAHRLADNLVQRHVHQHEEGIPQYPVVNPRLVTHHHRYPFDANRRKSVV